MLVQDIYVDTCWNPGCSTAAPPIMGGIAFAIGPSLGHFYAEEPKHALLTTALRLGALALTQVDDHDLAIQAGVYGALGLTLYDWMDASAAVHRHNRFDMAIVPTMAGVRANLVWHW